MFNLNKKIKNLENKGYKINGDNKDLLSIVENGFCSAVYHIGKTPLVTEGWSRKLGHHKTVYWRQFCIDIPTPRGIIKEHLGELPGEIRHAIKAYKAIRSGFVQMESKFSTGDGWEWQKFEPGDDLYYVCARFESGAHIPLPILAGWTEDNKLQRLAIRFAGGGKAVELANVLTEYNKLQRLAIQ